MDLERLKQQAAKLPATPGVYIMKNAAGEVIYVGKAKALKNRVSQYFLGLSSHTPKTRQMVSKIDTFETIFAPTEFEALLLENTLIKKYKPKYNILLKDDKGYPFICLSPGPYGRFSVVSRPGDKNKRYFGPYGGRGSANAAIKTVRDLFRLPDCSRVFPRDIGKGRPCLRRDIGKCCAPCSGEVSEKQYSELLEQACMALEGKVGRLVEELRRQMTEKSEAMEFEEAAVLRDRIKALSSMKVSQSVTGMAAGERDVIAYASKGGKGCLTLLTCRGGDLSGKTAFFFDGLEEGDGADVVSSFIKQHYPALGRAPSDICVSVMPEDKQALESMLSSPGARSRLTLPQKGEKKRLLDIAVGNCYSELEVRNIWEAKAMAPSRALEKMIGVENIEIIEAYDISNTAGGDPVASMTVFEKGRAVKRRWRKFKIKTAAGGDDYGAMEEVISRRLKKAEEGVEGFLPLPDLILVDGGQGQVNAALHAMDSSDVHIPVFGMVKNEHHRTRALVDGEGSEIGIQATPAVFSFIGNIQENTHSYAVEYHHKVHRSNTVRSELTSIPGVGAVRRDALLRAFGSVKRIREASLRELKAVVPEPAARAIIEHYAGEDGKK